MAVWQKERKMKREEYGIFVQCDMSLNWVSWVRQSLSPLHYSLAKVQAQLILRKTLIVTLKALVYVLLSHWHMLTSSAHTVNSQILTHIYIFISAIYMQWVKCLHSINDNERWMKRWGKKVNLSQFAGTWIRRELFMNLIVYKLLMFSTFTFSWLSVQRLDTRGGGFYDFMNLTTRTLLFLFFSF